MNTIKLNTIGDSPVVVKKGSQVQSQEKTVEITENGTTEVVPDAGFALSKVNLNVNVQGGGGNIEYLDLRNVTTMIGGQIPLKTLIGTMGYSCKFLNPSNSMVTLLGVPSLYTSFSTSQIQTLEVYEVEIDFNGIYGANQDRGIITYKDTLLSFGVTEEQLSALPRITKEEFYKLPVALTIYGPTEDDAIDYEDKMKTSFDTLWTIWERDGIDGQDLDITIPNADIASVTLINNEGTNDFNITSILGKIETTTSKIINSIRFNGRYGATLSKEENLTTGEIIYNYEFLG